MSVDPGSRGWNEHRHLLDVPGGWTGLVFSNTWADYGGAWATGAWLRDSLGFIHLRGLIKRTGGAPVGGETIVTLPLGARPPVQEIFTIRAYNGFYRIDIVTDGRIVFNGEAVGVPDGTNYASLSGVTFRTT